MNLTLLTRLVDMLLPKPRLKWPKFGLEGNMESMEWEGLPWRPRIGTESWPRPGDLRSEGGPLVDVNKILANNPELLRALLAEDEQYAIRTGQRHLRERVKQMQKEMTY